MPDKRTTDSRVDRLLNRVLALPEAEQVELHERVRDHLLSQGFQDEPEDRRLRAQREAIAAMQQVAKAQNLPDGEPPKTTGFNQQARALGLDWTVRRVGLAYGKWSLATLRYRTGTTPHQSRFITQSESMQYRGDQLARVHLDHIARWMKDTDPPHTRKAYMAWRAVENRQRKAAGEPPIVDWRSVQRLLPELDHNDILAAAQDFSLDTVALSRQRALERLDQNPNPLAILGPQTIAALTGRTFIATREALSRPGAPTPVLSLSATSAFLISDYEQWAKGGKAPARPPMSMQRLVWGGADIAARLGVKTGYVGTHNQAGRWHLVPPSDGSITGLYYWLREHVERWEQHRPTRAQVADGSWTPAALDG